MGALIDLTGKRFHRLTALKRVPATKPRAKARWLFLCDCGKEYETVGDKVFHGVTKSCGCHKADLARKRLTTHGRSETPEHVAWCCMKRRCTSKKAADYRLYGARGIRVCDRWLSFENFYADMGQRPSTRHSLGRIDNDRGYEPGNCRWEVPKQQCRNRRVTTIVEFRGKPTSISDCADALGIAYHTLVARYVKGERGDRLFRPVGSTSRWSP